MSSVQNQSFIEYFQKKYCFGRVLSYLGTSRDLTVIALLISKKMSVVFREESKNIRKFVALGRSNEELAICQQLPQLEELFAKFVQPSCDDPVTDMAVNYISHLSSLRILSYPRASIKTSIIRCFSKLEDLDLTACDLGSHFFQKSVEDDLKCFKKMSSLKKLKLPSCTGFADALNYLPTSLQVLHLSNCHLTDPKILHQLIDLRDLDLAKNRISDEAVCDLCEKLTKLETLRLDNLNCLSLSPRLGDAALYKLPKTLRVLSLQYSGITGKGLQFLQNLHNINLRGCRNIRDEDLTLLPPTLQSLDISMCQLTDAAIPNLPPNLECLVAEKHTSIACGPFITGATFSSLPKLKSLNVAYCKITNASLGQLPPTIEELKIRGCNLISNYGLSLLQPQIFSFYADADIDEMRDLFYLKSIPQKTLYTPPIALRKLDIGQIKLITNRGLASLPKLECLIVGGAVTAIGIFQYKRRWNFEPRVRIEAP